MNDCLIGEPHLYPGGTYDCVLGLHQWQWTHDWTVAHPHWWTFLVLGVYMIYVLGQGVSETFKKWRREREGRES